MTGRTKGQVSHRCEGEVASGEAFADQMLGPVPGAGRKAFDCAARVHNCQSLGARAEDQNLGSSQKWTGTGASKLLIDHNNEAETEYTGVAANLAGTVVVL